MTTLQVAGFLDHSTVNGEGFRSVLFLAGCPHHCPGCHNEVMQAYDYGEQITIATLLERITPLIPLIDGITLSGGEPFEQTLALLPFVKAIKALGLSIWCYTGYLYEDLAQDATHHLLLDYIDVLVDGPYVAHLKDETLKYCGSSNQRVLKLNNISQNN